MAKWLRLPTVRRHICLASVSRAICLSFVPTPDFSDRWHDFRKHTQAADVVVPGHLVRDEPEERRKCHQLAADTGVPQLSNRVDMAAQTYAEQWYARAVKGSLAP